MSQTASPMDLITTQNGQRWVQYIPDGAVSVEFKGSALVLRASNKLQERFETLLDKRKADTLSPEETRESLAPSLAIDRTAQDCG